MALAEPAQCGPANGDFCLDRNRDVSGLLPWAFCRGGARRAWTPGVESVLAVRGRGMIDPCVCQPGRGCAAQSSPLLPCNGRNDSSHRVLSPMQAKTSDQEDRQARRTKRSSRFIYSKQNGRQLEGVSSAHALISPRLATPSCHVERSRDISIFIIARMRSEDDPEIPRLRSE
jgi:hypothetical protein